MGTSKMNNKKIYFLGAASLFVLLCTAIACTSTEQRGGSTAGKMSVKEVMDNAITRLYESASEEQLQSIDLEQAMALFVEEELEVLASRHWVFEVNKPVVVSLMRSSRQENTPFWLEPTGFKKTGWEMRNTQHTYEVWQKEFDKGAVELGINGFENFTYHYFVSVAPLDPNHTLEITPIHPEQQHVSRLEDGAFTYHDWTELVLQDVPEAMKGQQLLTTIRGRGKESHVIGAFRKTPHPSSTTPDQVLLTWSADPSTSMDIQWRTNPSIETGKVIYRVANSTANPADEKSVEAEKLLMEDRELMNDRFCHRFTAKLRDLEPGTDYEYLIEPETDWSKANRFITANEANNSFSFIWFGDVHQKPEFGELHRQAERAHPETAFYIIAGDLVDDGLYRNQWDQLFEHSSDIIRQKPLMNVPGNHDNRMGLGAKMYRDMFSYPLNGPEGVPPKQTYSFTYKNSLFLMLDATTDIYRQTDWIEQQLANSTATWKFAVFHFPPYNGQAPYENIQQEWLPLFDEFQVDMVFSGHMHYYMRSKPIKGGKIAEGDERGTVYVISIGIPGRTEEIPEEPYAAVRNQGQGLYQHLRIDGNRLAYRSFNKEGDTVDTLEIRK